MNCQIPFSREKKKRKTCTGVFREYRCPPPMNFHFSPAVTLKIRSRSPKANQFFVMSQFYMHENLVIQHWFTRYCAGKKVSQ